MTPEQQESYEQKKLTLRSDRLLDLKITNPKKSKQEMMAFRAALHEKLNSDLIQKDLLLGVQNILNFKLAAVRETHEHKESK